MTDKRGNQTNYDLGLNESGELSSVGDLYNPGHPDSGREPRDPSGPVAFDQGQDISRAAKTTLGAYLSNLTKGNVGAARPNAFQVPTETNEAGAGFDENLSSRRPVTARADIESSGGTIGTFLDHAKGYTDSNKAARKFESTRNSNYGRNDTNPFLDPDIAIKNYSDPSSRRRGQDGNSILLNVEPRGSLGSSELGNPSIGPLRDDAPVVQRKISEVLRQNRFNPIEKAFVQNHTITGNSATLQRRLGVYVKDGAKEIRQDLLEQVGLKLMIRATGHSVPGQDLLDSTNNLQLTNNLAPLIPSAPQLTGLPLIDTVNLRAGNVAVAEDVEGVGVTPESARAEYINDIYPDGIDRSQENSRDAFTGKTYGVLNSHIEPFGGPLPIGTFTTTVAGIIVIVGASALVSLLPLLLGGDTNFRPRVPTLNADPSRLIKGKRGFLLPGATEDEEGQYSNDNIQEYVLSLLGIPKTDHNWGQCLLVGIGTFFGIEINPGIAGQGVSIDTDSILSSLFNLVTAPGYYAVIIRNAIRDTEQIVRAIEDFGSAVSNINVVAAISGLFKIIESITTSALYRFIMSMTALGNQVLNYVPGTNSFPGMNAMSDSVEMARLRMRSRISEDPADRTLSFEQLQGDLGRKSGSALAWKHSSTYSKYILPLSFTNAHNDGQLLGNGGRPEGMSATTSGGRFERTTSAGANTARLDSDDVKRIEDVLEAEYVPFYFHDLRTNEIISFHAFLSDLSDGFTASYNETTSYGRADGVMVYSNTKRSISLGFQVVATSIEDFDVMYWNINKLVTMLYPQYSSGRTMTSGDTRFIQPFSQIPTASPMIRLRVGDIVRGNYSKFGLARLFGLGNQSLSIGVSERVSAEQQLIENERRHQARVEAEFAIMSRRPHEGSTNTFRTGDIVTINAIERDSPIWSDRRGERCAHLEPGRRRERRRPRTEWVPNGDVPGLLSTAIRSRSAASRSIPQDARARIVDIIRPSDANIRSDIASVITGPGTGADDLNLSEVIYLVEYIPSPDREGAMSSVLGDYKYFYVRSAEIINLADDFLERLIEEEISRSNPASSPEVNTAGIQREFSDFFSNANPVVRSFESTIGRGLAGFITDLKMDWSDVTWETAQKKRAPKSMKISLSFSPIHDIPMGLDADGMMRSVAYNIGDLSRVVGGDQYNGFSTTASTGATSAPGTSSTSEGS